MHSQKITSKVKITVKPNKRDFDVHEGILIDQIPYFARSLLGRKANLFKEGIHKVFELEGNDEVFSNIVEYIYTKNIEIMGDIKAVDGPNAATPNIFMLIKV